MPIYEYICQKCGQDIEVIQKFSDPPLKKCEACGGRLEKKLSLTSFQLKGGGWYADGYHKKPPAEKSTSKTSDKSEPPKGEQKPTKKEKPKTKTEA